MSGFKSVLLAGTTGYVGTPAANVFLDTPGWTVHILTSVDTLTKKKDIIDSFIARGAKIITADVSKPETYVNQLVGIDVVFSFLAPSLANLSIALAQASKQAGVKLFIPSEYSFELSFIGDNPVAGVKQIVRNEVEALGLNFMYIITGPFYEYLIACTEWGNDPKNKKVAQIGERSTKTTAASMEEVIKLLPDIINDPNNLNKSLFFGYTITIGEVVDSIVEVIGKDVEVSVMTLEVLKQKVANSHSFVDSVILLVMSVIASGKSEGPNPIDGTKYGKPLSRFNDFVPKYVSQLHQRDITVHGDKNESGFQKVWANSKN